MQTTAGRPIPITKEWFRARYGQNFPDLLSNEKDEFLSICIKDVYTLFYGVGELWSYLDRKLYEDKTQMCYGLLVAWYISDLFPDFAVGVMSSGGIPIAMKKIGGVQIKFGDLGSTAGAVNNADLLQSLKSNTFGAKAYQMIKMSGRLNTYINTGATYVL